MFRHPAVEKAFPGGTQRTLPPAGRYLFPFQSFNLRPALRAGAALILDPSSARPGDMTIANYPAELDRRDGPVTGWKGFMNEEKHLIGSGSAR